MMIHHWILANLQWFLSLSDIPTLRRCFCWWSATWMQCRRLSDRPQSLDKLARLERNERVSLVSHRKTAEFLGSAGAPMEMMSHISQMMFQNRHWTIWISLPAPSRRRQLSGNFYTYHLNKLLELLSDVMLSSSCCQVSKVTFDSEILVFLVFSSAIDIVLHSWPRLCCATLQGPAGGVYWCSSRCCERNQRQEGREKMTGRWYWEDDWPDISCWDHGVAWRFRGFMKNVAQVSGKCN